MHSLATFLNRTPPPLGMQTIVGVASNKPVEFAWRYYSCFINCTALSFFVACLYFHLQPNQHWCVGGLDLGRCRYCRVV